jgi:hypothetical protein
MMTRLSRRKAPNSPNSAYCGANPVPAPANRHDCREGRRLIRPDAAAYWFHPWSRPHHRCGSPVADRPAAPGNSLNTLMLNAEDAARLGVGDIRSRSAHAPPGDASHPEKGLLSRLSRGHFSRYSWRRRLPAGGPGRAPLAKPRGLARQSRLAREFLCCELQNRMILPVCNSQRP